MRLSIAEPSAFRTLSQPRNQKMDNFKPSQLHHFLMDFDAKYSKITALP